jgi:prolipoprotein diacylglyceryltransferase
MSGMPLASIPSPARSVWHLGPLPVRAQALCIIAGILLAIALTDRRYRKSGGAPGVIAEVAAWVVPASMIPAIAGLILGDGKSWFSSRPGLLHALRELDWALGFPGAVACGLIGAAVACRRIRGGSGGKGPAREPRLASVAGAAAPAVAFGHAVASLGSWVSQTGYGRPSSAWWGVRISPVHRIGGFENFATFQPVWGYQILWDLASGVIVILATRWFSLSGNKSFALVAVLYAAGGLALGMLRIGQLPLVVGIRAGELGDGALFILALAYLIRLRRGRRTPHRVRSLETESSRDVMST